MQPNALLTQFLATMADHPESLRQLAPATAALVLSSPVVAAATLSSMDDESREAALSAVDVSSVIELVRESENEGEDVNADDVGGSLAQIMTMLRAAKRVTAEQAADYVVACADCVEFVSDAAAKVNRLSRLVGWAPLVKSGDAVRALVDSIEPLTSVAALSDLDAADRATTLNVAGEFMVAASKGLGNLEVRFAEYAASEQATAEEAEEAARFLSRRVDRYMPYPWPFAETLIAAAEGLGTATPQFARLTPLLAQLIGKTTADAGLDEQQRLRIASVVRRGGAASRARVLIKALIANPLCRKTFIELVTANGAPADDLAKAIWEDAAEARARIVDARVDTTSPRSVAASLRSLRRLVDEPSLCDATAEYVRSLKGESPDMILRVVRGVSSSGLGVDRSLLSGVLLDAMSASDRAARFRILDIALSTGLVGSHSEAWKEAAKAVDGWSLGNNQEKIMKRARRTLRYRRVPRA